MARDVLVEAMLRTKDLAPIVGSVHDEVIYETRETDTLFPLLKAKIEVLPPWAPGLPVKADGKIRSRYGK
jgi:hypothetical protein